MSWIQENKYIAGVAGVTAVLAGVILYFGLTKGSEYDEKKGAFEDLNGKYKQLANAKPYPSAANLSQRKKSLEDYEKSIRDVEKMFAKYQPGKLPSITPEQFSDAQVKMATGLRKAFEKAQTTLPDGCEFGFEKYANVPPKAEATPLLNYELGAIEWILSTLAETQPEALINVRRAELPVEKGIVSSTPKTRGKKKGRKGRNKKRGETQADEPTHLLLPVELAFKTDEKSLRKFLQKVVGSKKYYYAIRAIRIRNEKQSAPNVKDAKFPEANKEKEDDFAAMEFAEDSETDSEGGGSENAAVKPTVSERILKQVLGDEKINVYISFDILLVKGAKKGSVAEKSQTNN